MVNLNDLPTGCTLGPDAYAAWRASETGVVTDRIERRLIFDLLGDVAGRRVLDVGCGDGELAIALRRRGARVVGIDASDAMIAAARRRARQEEADVSFLVAAAQALPFPQHSFDTVVAVTILCFIPNAAPVFREMARILTPGGGLVIGELGRWSSWAAQRRIRGWLGSPLWRNARFRTAAELRIHARSAGFAVETVRGAVYYPRWKVAARLLGGCDRLFGCFGTFGAAFLALSAHKEIELSLESAATEAGT
jgi:ubiquinone biosynthesis O-methyltransferase